ncbi:MAG: L-aspartate oxidase [Candidatus Margulisiibacteriota bacterium]
MRIAGGKYSSGNILNTLKRATGQLPRRSIQECDVLILGGGIAGLRAALTASEFAKVVLLTKGKVGESATEKAQGGIAVAVDMVEDSPALHLEDTLVAGAGLCSREAVEILVTEGVERVKELIAMGARFDAGETSTGFALGLEGAHGRRRILHAGDSTGHEIAKTLGYQVIHEGKVEVAPLTLGINLLTEDGKCHGVVALDIQNNVLTTYLAKATIIATGGVCQTYLYSTNPTVATGDGIAMAYNAGAEVTDMEFVQFHPTSLAEAKEFATLGRLPQFLISEAVRGEGGILLNSQGERFMPGYHQQSDLAPRDIVSRAIFAEMAKTGSSSVFLQLTLEAEKTRRRFPMIYENCLARGLDITKEPIPVSPAAHYFMGGIKTDTDARTNLQYLYAAGESASLGVHGANRLASNSLLDGLVFGHRAALTSREDMGHKMRKIHSPLTIGLPELDDDTIYGMARTLKTVMWQNVGIIRTENSLSTAQRELAALGDKIPIQGTTKGEIELRNMLRVARLITQAARDRTESRGGHYRDDFPTSNDSTWGDRHLTYAREMVF